MMPLTYARPGEQNKIVRVGGNEKIKKFLESLGFVPGSDVVLVSENHGNVITKIKESRIAIGKEMANKIMI